jgi:metal-responsive CopG/Arc/MetJ family transcriptional regulator
MRPIQILLDEELIRTVDREAKRLRSNRSKFIRAALSAYLAATRRRTLDERYRRGYEQKPAGPEELGDWERIQEWPEE